LKLENNRNTTLLEVRHENESETLMGTI
jgi:hypothetical protein